MYSAAAICRSTHLPIPQEGRIITSDDVFGHLPDIRCINGGIDAAPAPPLDGAGQCAGLPGVLSEAGGRLPLHPKTRRSRAARYFGLPDKEISSGAVVMRWPAIYNKGSKIREEAHPVAKHLDKFTQPFRDSPIPFALAEILTNGSGEMVDLVCRFLNPAAAALLGLSPEEVQGRRLSQLGPERALEQLAPMQAVAFSGSSASFPYVTAGGQTLTVTCYQVMYGTVACLLDPRSGAGAQSGALPELLPGADLELNREGLRCLACSRQLCQLTQWSRRALLDRGGRAFSALVAPADWPGAAPGTAGRGAGETGRGSRLPPAAAGRWGSLGESPGGNPVDPPGGHGLPRRLSGYRPPPAGGAGPAGGPFPAGDGSAGCGDAAGPDAGRSLPAAPPT